MILCFGIGEAKGVADLEEKEIKSIVSQWFEGLVWDENRALSFEWQPDDSKPLFVGAASVLSFPSEKIEEVLDEVDSYVNWVPDAIQVKLHRQVSLQNWIFYNATDVRWPYKDRQSLIDMKKALFGEGGLRYSFSLVHDEQYDWHEKRTMVVDSQGSWTVFPLDEGRTLVSYVIFLDVGGNIPKALAKPHISKIPPNNLLGLERYLRSQN